MLDSMRIETLRAMPYWKKLIYISVLTTVGLILGIFLWFVISCPWWRPDHADYTPESLDQIHAELTGQTLQQSKDSWHILNARGRAYAKQLEQQKKVKKAKRVQKEQKGVTLI
jgi:hypothetical protein